MILVIVILTLILMLTVTLIFILIRILILMLIHALVLRPYFGLIGYLDFPFILIYLHLYSTLRFVLAFYFVVHIYTLLLLILVHIYMYLCDVMFIYLHSYIVAY